MNTEVIAQKAQKMTKVVSCFKCRFYGSYYCFQKKESLFIPSYSESEKRAKECEDYQSRY